MIYKEGDKGEPVVLIQTKLSELGFYPKEWVDGDFGPITKTAVKNFQLSKGLEDDGKVGPITWGILFAESRDLSDVPWMTVAEAEIGVREIPGPVDNKRIEEYFTYVNYPVPEKYVDEIHWCAAFLCAVLEMSGYRSPRSAWSQAWLNWGIPCNPLYGAVVIFKYTPRSGHVGLIHRVSSNGLWVLGGNQSDSVNISFFSTRNVVGYRLPRAEDKL